MTNVCCSSHEHFELLLKINCVSGTVIYLNLFQFHFEICALSPHYANANVINETSSFWYSMPDNNHSQVTRLEKNSK